MSFMECLPSERLKNEYGVLRRRLAGVLAR
jgi:hypothetical protein